MNEDEKIKAILEEYNVFLEKSNCDVCHSIKGVWFFYRYDSKNVIYECFYKFSTAEELERIIIGEVLDTVNVAIECTAEEVVLANNKQLELIEMGSISDAYDLEDRLDKFELNVKAIHRTKHLVDEAYVVIQSLLSKD